MAAQLVIGNTAERFDAERTSWTLYVRGSTSHIKEIIVWLHPSFRNPSRKLSKEPFELKCRGWGTFDIDITVVWKAGGELKTEWGLQFDKPDACRKVEVPLAIVEGRAASPASGRGAALPAVAVTPAAPPAPVPSGDAAGGEARERVAEHGASERGGRGAPGTVAQAAAVGGVSLGDRESICAQLTKAGFLSQTDPKFMHGRGYSGPLRPPPCTWKSAKPPRDDHEAPAWLTASEFQDEPEVMKAKCSQLAHLMRLSRKTVVYTGAGISASVIGQAARSGENKVGWKPDTRRAKPTLTHHVLGYLGQQNLIHSWVQQNHDGLPQKAGFPQERINEIHGSWYDPSNPVVKYSGTLHERAFPWMEKDAATADLVLVLGTSLGGLNADQVATSAAERSRCPGGALGTACINLQQTEQDGKMTLRLFGKSDDVLRLLLSELGIGQPRCDVPVWPKESRVLVPYDAKGNRVQGARKMWLDLRDGQLIRITRGHNIQGARQPMYMHIGAKTPVTVNGVLRQPAEGLGRVDKREDDTASFLLNIESAQMRLGLWWLDVARRGAVDVLPIVNQNPSFEG